MQVILLEYVKTVTRKNYISSKFTMKADVFGFVKHRKVTCLSERHLGDDGQHDLLAFGRVRVLAVFVEPGLERVRRFSRGVFPPGRAVHRSVPEKCAAMLVFSNGLGVFCFAFLLEK